MKAQDAWRKRNLEKEEEERGGRGHLGDAGSSWVLYPCVANLLQKDFHLSEEYLDCHSQWTCWRGKPEVFSTSIFLSTKNSAWFFGEIVN